MHRSLRLAPVAAGAAALAVALAPAAAHADTVGFDYDAVGTAHIAKPNADVKLGPTTLHADLESADGSFTGSLPIPTSSASFKIAGFIPTSAKVSFIPAGKVTGKLNLTDTGTSVTSTARYYIKLTDVKTGGFPAFAGNKCQTVAPVTVPANTPAGENFDLADGGTLKGTFTIGKFANCGATTNLINSLVPGGGNTVSLKVSNGRAS